MVRRARLQIEGPPPKAQDTEKFLNAQAQRTDKRSWFDHERFLTGERRRAIWSNLPPKAQPAVSLFRKAQPANRSGKADSEGNP